ncbi:MAG: carboxypeptidase-like regulatory domain-containing protein [Candidatus Micrarchaeia archaeon]
MRGQASTEYLVVLGAVLAVGLVAVGTMAALPSFGQMARQQQLDQYWMAATPFSITAIKLSDGNFSLSVANNAKKPEVLTGIELGTGTQVIQFWASNGSQSFRPGQETVVANESFNFSGNPCFGKPVGTYYEFDNITLVYTEGSIPGMRQAGMGIAGACSGVDLTSPAVNAQPGYAFLSGYVHDASGAGLASARINVTNATNALSAVTDASGYYWLNVPLSGSSQFSVNASSGAMYNYTATTVLLITETPATLNFVIGSQPGIEYITFIRDASGSNVAAFTTSGNLVLKGGCYSGASCSTPPDGSLIIRDSSGTAHAYINSSGSLCVEDANCNYYDSNCNDAPDGSLILRSPSGANATYISPTGTLCTIGEIWQYGTP